MLQFQAGRLAAGGNSRLDRGGQKREVGQEPAVGGRGPARLAVFDGPPIGPNAHLGQNGY